MFNYSSDREQSELLQKWWQRNKLACLLSLVLFLGSIAIFQWWQNYRAQEQINSATMFSELLEQPNIDKANKLVKTHPNSPYADFANFWLADKYCEESKWQDAISMYDRTINKSKIKALVAVAHWLKAHALTELKQYNQALSELDHLEHQKTLTDEYRGDIYSLMGRKELAYSAYDAAKINNLDKNITKRIMLKQQNLFLKQ